MNKLTIARWISIVGHPFTFIALLLVLPFWTRGQVGALRVTGIVLVAAFVPLGLFMRHRRATGKWQTVDASVPSERPAAFVAVFVALLPVTLYFALVERSTALVRGTAVIALMVCVAALLNRWIKLCGHLAFAGMSAVVLARVRLSYGLTAAMFIPLLAWSRLVLLRHTLPEIIWGLILGITAGGVMLWR